MRNSRRLTAALVLAAVYLGAEIAGGLLTNSLALLADAGHMLSDVAALALSLFAIRIAQRRPDDERTYGFYRSEILAAMVNGAALAAIAVFILVEVYQRLLSPPEVAGRVMMLIAAGGLLVNLVSLRILGAGRSESLNVRGAWLHVLTDTLGSVQAILAGLLIWLFGWRWADPVASALIAVLVLFSAWSLLRESVSVLMEGVPGHLQIDDVDRAIRGVPGVVGVHDLHVWTITSGFVALSAHVTVSSPDPQVVWRVRDVLRERFDIEHSTIQVEEQSPPAPIRPPA